MITKQIDFGSAVLIKALNDHIKHLLTNLMALTNFDFDDQNIEDLLL